MLRAAINRRFEGVIESLIAKRRGVPFVDRRLQAFRTTDKIQDSQLRALLVIDGDIDRAHDLEALQVALIALHRGYSIFRRPLAARINTNVKDLDDRVAAIVRTWLETMAKPPAT